MGALRAILAVGGAVACAVGLWTMLAGVGTVSGDVVASRNVDSEMRFFGGIYLGYGAALLWTAPRAAQVPGLVRILALALFAAGIGRALGWALEGRPEDGQLALLAIELLAPPLVLGLQRRTRPTVGGRR